MCHKFWPLSEIFWLSEEGNHICKDCEDIYNTGGDGISSLYIMKDGQWERNSIISKRQSKRARKRERNKQRKLKQQAKAEKVVTPTERYTSYTKRCTVCDKVVFRPVEIGNLCYCATCFTPDQPMVLTQRRCLEAKNDN